MGKTDKFAKYTKRPFLTVKIEILKIRVCFLVQQNTQIQGYVEKNDLCHDHF